MKHRRGPGTPANLVAFYRGEARNTMGYKIDQISQWGFQDLEHQHDYIQWLFPTPAPSDYSPDAPVLSVEDIAAFRSDPWLRLRLRRSLERFLPFLGLALLEDGRIVDGDNFSERQAKVWAYQNHSWLRVSRVLTSLTVLGLEAEAKAFFAWLDDAHRRGRIGSCDEASRQEAARSHGIWASRARPREEGGSETPHQG